MNQHDEVEFSPFDWQWFEIEMLYMIKPCGHECKSKGLVHDSPKKHDVFLIKQGLSFHFPAKFSMGYLNFS